DHYGMIWGIDRLPRIVSTAMAEKYGKAVAHLHACIDREDADATAVAAAYCIKGLHAMDAAARKDGHSPSPVTVWQAEHEGQTIGVIRDVADQQRASKAHPGVMIVTLREVAVAMHHYRYSLVNADIVKAAFPGAEISAIRTRSKTESDLDDEIPF
ncbi:MAG: hypothetical protein ACRC0L_08915, partial [Angustibacter sp.]